MLGFFGGTIEIRLDIPSGQLLGQLDIAAANPVFPGMTANSAQNNGGAKGKPAKAPAPPLVAAKKGAKKPAADFNPFAAPGIKKIFRHQRAT